MASHNDESTTSDDSGLRADLLEAAQYLTRRGRLTAGYKPTLLANSCDDVLGELRDQKAVDAVVLLANYLPVLLGEREAPVV